MRKSLLSGNVDVGREPASRQRIAELHAQEAGGRVARDVEVVLTHDTPNHLGVAIDEVRQDVETSVVHHRVDLATDRSKRYLKLGKDRIYVGLRAYIKPLEVDEEEVLLGVVAEA